MSYYGDLSAGFLTVRGCRLNGQFGDGQGELVRQLKYVKARWNLSKLVETCKNMSRRAKLNPDVKKTCPDVKKTCPDLKNHVQMCQYIRFIYATFVYENSKIYDFENRAVFKVVVFKFEALNFFSQWYFGGKIFLGIFGPNIFILQIFHFRTFSKFLILKLVIEFFENFTFSFRLLCDLNFRRRSLSFHLKMPKLPKNESIQNIRKFTYLYTENIP